MHQPLSSWTSYLTTYETALRKQAGSLCTALIRLLSALVVCTGSLGLIIAVSSTGGCAVILVAAVSLFCCWRMQQKYRSRRKSYLLVNEEESSYYGSASQSLVASTTYPKPSFSNEGIV